MSEYTVPWEAWRASVLAEYARQRATKSDVDAISNMRRAREMRLCWAAVHGAEGVGSIEYTSALIDMTLFNSWVAGFEDDRVHGPTGKKDLKQMSAGS